MKVVFVAGFFTPVLKKLEEDFADQIKSRRVIWIRQVGPHGGVNIKEFRENFNDRLAVGAREVLVLVAALKGKEYLFDQIAGVIDTGKQKWPGATVTVEHIKDAAAKDWIASRVRAFSLEVPGSESTISVLCLKRKVAGGRILCVREATHTSFKRAFCRAGFPEEVWDEFFDEETFDHGKLNHLVSWLQQKSKSYSRIVYAWHGLKYVGDADLECPLHQAGDVRGALDRFRQWVMSETTE